jgi:hypothetical protein
MMPEGKPLDVGIAVATPVVRADIMEASVFLDANTGIEFGVRSHGAEN